MNRLLERASDENNLSSVAQSQVVQIEITDIRNDAWEIDVPTSLFNPYTKELCLESYELRDLL